MTRVKSMVFSAPRFFVFVQFELVDGTIVAYEELTEDKPQFPTFVMVYAATAVGQDGKATSANESGESSSHKYALVMHYCRIVEVS